MIMTLLASPPTPPALLAPKAVWFFNWVIPIAGGLVILATIADCVRRRRLTWGFLFLINSMLVYWMETIGDWGQHVIYSPVFARHHLLDWLPLKSPNDPIFMPFAYAVYWTVHAVIVLYLAKWLVNRYGWSMLKACIVLSIPVNYGWNALVEGYGATQFGWWTYDPGMGPYFTHAGGGRWTLLWTVGLMCIWPNLSAYWAGKPPVGGLNHMERFFGLARFVVPKPTTRDEPMTEGVNTGTGSAATAGTATVTAPLARQKLSPKQAYDAHLNYDVTIARWKFETMRFGAWFLTFQVSFFVLLIIPLVTMRLITGHDSIYAPPNL